MRLIVLSNWLSVILIADVLAAKYIYEGDRLVAVLCTKFGVRKPNALHKMVSSIDYQVFPSHEGSLNEGGISTERSASVQSHRQVLCNDLREKNQIALHKILAMLFHRQFSATRIAVFCNRLVLLRKRSRHK